VESPIVFVLFLGLSISMERPIDIVLFIIIFFPPKKKIYAVMRIVKLCGPLYPTSRKMFSVHSQHLNFDLLWSHSTSCEKPLLADLLENR
jgi:hypothetical protein